MYLLFVVVQYLVVHVWSLLCFICPFWYCSFYFVHNYYRSFWFGSNALLTYQITLNSSLTLLDFSSTLEVDMEKAMAPHSSTLAWKISWMEEPGRLQSMGSRRVGHDWVTSLSLFTFMRWRRKWQPTPVFLPGESQGRGSLVGCRLWGCTESDTTEVTYQQ